MLTAIGAIGALNVDTIPVALVERARHVHLGGFFLQQASRDRLPAFFAAARSRGLTTSFDTNWDPSERWDGGVLAVLREADVFLPNEAEVTRIAGVADPRAAAEALVARGSAGRTDGGPVVVVKRGDAGALASRGSDPTIAVAALPVEPVDTTGAGDSFNAGFLRAWLDGASLGESLELGAVCGALSTTRTGGIDGQPTLDEARAARRAWTGA
jgi:sugar/nucleoside kinase (ribokinase family)